MHEPLLTIAIPTYNRVRELEHLIGSILPQMTPAVEILVSDNASSDTTPDFMGALAAENPAVRYVRQTSNLGIDRNVDAAVENSAGRFVWVCGDDDELEPFALAHLLAVLQGSDFATGWINYSSWDFDLLKCRDGNIARINEDVLDADIGTVLRISHFFFSFASTHVVRRDLWMAAEGRKKCFVPPYTDCIWMLGHLLAGVGRKNFVIGRPILRQRTSRYDERKIAEIPIALNWCGVMKVAVSMGVKEQDVEPFFRAAVNGLHLTRGLLHKKRFAPHAARREARAYFRLFWNYPLFWVSVVPLFMMPSFLLRAIQRIYRSARRLNGVKYLEDASV